LFVEIKVNDKWFVVRVVEERFGYVDLGVRREDDVQLYSERRIDKSELLIRRRSIGCWVRGATCETNLVYGWNDGWSGGVPCEHFQVGYCPKDKTIVVWLQVLQKKGLDRETKTY
jgi:hypothetical protein